MIEERTATDKVLREISEERADQMCPDYDDVHNGKGELARAAAGYAIEPATAYMRISSSRIERWRELFPWAGSCDKRKTWNRRRRLLVAATLLVAEIERLDRLEA